MAFLHSSYFAWYPLLMWFQSIKFCLLINLLVRVVACIYLSTECYCIYVYCTHVKYIFTCYNRFAWLYLFLLCLWIHFRLHLVCIYFLFLTHSLTRNHCLFGLYKSSKRLRSDALTKNLPWLNTSVVASISLFFFLFLSSTNKQNKEIKRRRKKKNKKRKHARYHISWRKE